MDAALLSSNQMRWETPASLFEALDSRFNFRCDVAASSSNAKCPIYFTAEDNALDLDWKGRCFMNPPYGRAITQWVRKADYEVTEGNASIVVGLVPARVDTQWFQDYCSLHLHRFVRGRIVFELDGQPMLDKKGRPMPAPFPSALVYFGL